MLFSILSGAILFKEFAGYYWYNYVGLIIAAIIIFCGVYKLSPHQTNEPQQQEVLNTLTSNSRESIASSANISLCIGDAANPMNDQFDAIDPVQLSKAFNNLRDDDDDMKSTQNQEVIRSSTLDLPANSRSLRTIQRFFETSGKMLSDFLIL